MTRESRVSELRRELERAEQREKWEIENPDAIAAAYASGKDAGFRAGWDAGCKWLGQMALHAGDLHRTTPPEPLKVSLEKIAELMEAHKGDLSR